MYKCLLEERNKIVKLISYYYVHFYLSVHLVRSKEKQVYSLREIQHQWDLSPIIQDMDIILNPRL